MLQLLSSVLRDCKMLVSVEILSELPCGYLVQQACAIFCQTQENVKLGKQTANCFIPNHREEKKSCLLSFIWVMVSSILWYIWLPSYCAGNYTVNIQNVYRNKACSSLYEMEIYSYGCTSLNRHKTFLHFVHDDTWSVICHCSLNCREPSKTPTAASSPKLCNIRPLSLQLGMVLSKAAVGLLCCLVSQRDRVNNNW